MKGNYHTHTTRCHHASGSDEEYVLEAIKGEIDVLGFSDHSPWKYDSDFVPRMRMTLAEFEDYYQSINVLKEKYKDQIKILIGLEAEYYPKYMKWLDEFLAKGYVDYIILGNHFKDSDEYGEYYGRIATTDSGLKSYLDSSLEAMEYEKYSYFAHPDLYMRNRTSFGEDEKKVAYAICEKAKELDLLLEYNLEGLLMNKENGILGYPYIGFWQIAAEVGNRVIIGVDAHKPSSLSDVKRFNEAKELLESMGLVVESEIPLLKDR